MFKQPAKDLKETGYQIKLNNERVRGKKNFKKPQIISLIILRWREGFLTWMTFLPQQSGHRHSRWMHNIRHFSCFKGELCSFFFSMCSSWMGWLPSSGSGLTSEFLRMIKKLLFDSQLLCSHRRKKKKSSSKGVIWAIRGTNTTRLCKVTVAVFIFSCLIKACWSEHNICFHCGIFWGIRNSGPESFGIHVGDSHPLISFPECIPMTWQCPICACPGLREKEITATKRQWWEREGERTRLLGVLMVVQ